MEKDKWLRPIDGIGGDISVSALTTASKSIRGLKPGAMEGVYDWHKRFPRKADGTSAEPRDATHLATRPRAEAAAAAPPRKPLVVPVTLLRTAGSQRTNDDIVALVEGVNQIIAQADVSIEVIEFLEWKQSVVVEAVNGIFSCPLADKIGHRGGLLQIAFVPTIEKYLCVKCDCDRCGFVQDHAKVDAAHLMAQLITKMLGVPQAPLHSPTHLTSHAFKGRVLTPVDSQILRWHAARAGETTPDWQPPQLKVAVWIYRVTAPTYAAKASLAEIQAAVEAAAALFAPARIHFHVHATCDLGPHELDDAACAEIVGGAHAGEAFPKLQGLIAHAPNALHIFSLGKRKTWAISGSAKHPILVMAAFTLSAHRAIAMNFTTILGVGRVPYKDSLTAVNEAGTYLSPSQIERARASAQDRFGPSAAAPIPAPMPMVAGPSATSAGIGRSPAPPSVSAAAHEVPLRLSGASPSPGQALGSAPISTKFGSNDASPPIGVRFGSDDATSSIGTRFGSADPAPAVGTRFGSADPAPAVGTRFGSADPAPAVGTRLGSADSTPASIAVQARATGGGSVVRVPLTVHLVDNARYGTKRDEAAALALIGRLDDLWAEAGVRFEPRVVRTSAPDFVIESATPRVINAAAPAPRPTADLLRTLPTFDTRAINVFLLEKIIMRSSENATCTLSALSGDYAFLLSDASGEKHASIAILQLTTILRADASLPADRLLHGTGQGAAWTPRELAMARAGVQFFVDLHLAGDRGYDLVTKNGVEWEKYLHGQMSHLTKYEGEVCRYLAMLKTRDVRWRLVFGPQATTTPPTRLVTEGGRTFAVSTFTNSKGLQGCDFHYLLMMELTRAVLASVTPSGRTDDRLLEEVCVRKTALAMMQRLGYNQGHYEKSVLLASVARFIESAQRNAWPDDEWKDFVDSMWAQACPNEAVPGTVDRQAVEALTP